MRKVVLAVLPLAMALTVFGADKKKTTAKAAPAPAAVTVPTDATEIAPHVWRATDKAGKVWIYRQTPFGLSKVEDQSASIAAANAVAPKVEVKATDLGDTVRFEKPNPMGTTVWTRKKSELSADEKSWLESTKSAPSGGSAAGK